MDQRLNEVPRERIGFIIEQVASAARFLLEERNTVHRDIKPSNIAISDDFSHATLLDLGVQKPLDAEDLTDLSEEDSKPFVGTLRYAAPEYLFGTVEETIEGWTAVTFYQLGAVLHDLIQRAVLFKEHTQPYAQLVWAVRERIPQFTETDVELRLVELAKRCLAKNWKVRLKAVRWEDFASVRREDSSDTARLAIARARAVASVPPQAETTPTSKQVAKEAVVDLRASLRTALIRDDDIPRRMRVRQERPLEDGSYQVRIEFPPSVQFGNSANICCVLTLKCLDPLSRVIEVSVAGFVCRDVVGDGEPMQFTAIWVGSSDVEGVVPKATTAILSVLAAGITLSGELNDAVPCIPIRIEFTGDEE